MQWPWHRAERPVTDAAPRVPPAGWAFLPPLQRQLADAAPATLRPAFVSSLPTRSMPSSLGTMGHLVDDGAPAGTFGVDDAALGAPVQRAPAADLTLGPPAAVPGGVEKQRVPDDASEQRMPDDAARQWKPAPPEPAPPEAAASGTSVERAPDGRPAPPSPERVLQPSPTESRPAPVQRRVGLGAPLAPPTAAGSAAEVASAPAEVTAPHQTVPTLSRTPAVRATDLHSRADAADPDAPPQMTSVSRSAAAPDVPTGRALRLPIVETPAAQSPTDRRGSEGEEQARADAARGESAGEETAPILGHSRVLEPTTLGSVDGATTLASPVVANTRPALQRAHADASTTADRIEGATVRGLDSAVPTLVAAAGPSRSVPIVAARSIEPAIGARPLGPEPTRVRSPRVVAARVIAPGAPAHSAPSSSSLTDPSESASSSRSAVPVDATRVAAGVVTQAVTARGDHARDAQRMPEAPGAASVSRSITPPPTPVAGVHARMPADSAASAPVMQRAFGLPSLPSAPRTPSIPQLPSAANLPTMPSLPSVSDLPSVPGLPTADGLRDRAADAVPDLADEASGAADAVRGAASHTLTQAGQALSAAGGAGASAASGSENVEQLVRTLYGPLVRRIKAELLLDRERRGIRIDGI